MDDPLQPLRAVLHPLAAAGMLQAAHARRLSTLLAPSFAEVGHEGRAAALLAWATTLVGEGEGQTPLAVLEEELARSVGHPLTLDLSAALEQLTAVVGQRTAEALKKALTQPLPLHRFFRYEASGLVPVTPRPVPGLSAYAGQDEARKRLAETFAWFAAGAHATACLLYGPRGTGKSSAVVAAMAEPGMEPLRLVELPVAHLGGLEALVRRLGRGPGRYLVLLDDLSFHMDEEGWRSLKILMEGVLDDPLKDVLLVATSNRKDLVSRPEELSSSLRGREQLQALRALDDRFVIKIPFHHMNDDALLAALKDHLAQAGLPPKPKEHWKAFRRFCLENNLDEPNGRAVRDYVLTLTE